MLYSGHIFVETYLEEFSYFRYFYFHTYENRRSKLREFATYLDDMKSTTKFTEYVNMLDLKGFCSDVMAYEPLKDPKIMREVRDYVINYYDSGGNIANDKK